MPGLYNYLGLGAGSILTQQAGLGSAGHNLANLNTPGFSRTRLDVRSHLGPPTQGGASAGRVERYEDLLLSGRERSSRAESGRTQHLARALAQLEANAAEGSGTIPENLGAFFGALRALEARPQDPGSRQFVVRSAEALAQSIRRTDEAIRSSIEETNQRIEGFARRANELASSLASINARVAQNPDPTLLDQRDQLALEISELLGGQLLGANGEAKFVLGDGTVLVDGDKARPLEARRLPGPPTAAILEQSGGSATRRVEPMEGAFAGQVQARERFASMLGEVDALAFDLATSFNATHRGFAGLDGVAGRDFFDEPTTASGAAANLRVSAAVSANSGLLASMAPGAGQGDNSGVRALAGLASEPLAGGGSRTFLEQALSTPESLGEAVRAAQLGSDLAAQTEQVLGGLRDALSGVSAEEEMTRMIAFQRASEASIRFVQTVDSLLGSLLEGL